MCGIICIKNKLAKVDRTKLQQSLEALRHRGPDGNGLWIADNHLTGLGHTRLSIIDLDTGTQPISNEDNSIHIVVNGEFYDYEAIREELTVRDHQFRTRSDSEIALHLYEEYGLDFFKYLRGEFAFILYDQNKDLLLAARDRFGIKPLCFYADSKSLIIASEAKAIFAAGVPSEWDEEAYYHSTCLHYLPADRTLFKNIYQLKPGEYLAARKDRIDTHCYWDLDYPAENKDPSKKDEKQVIEEFRELLSESVRLRMRSDVPVCCHLSGGLDSSAVLALASHNTGKAVPCFTVSFENDSYDELQIAKEMAAFSDSPLFKIRVTQSDLINNLKDAVYYCEGLAINGHLGAKYLLSKKIHQAGFKVALTGEGSDEILGGYAHLREDLLRSQDSVSDQNRINRLYQTNGASSGIMLPYGSSLDTNSIRTHLGYVPSFLHAKASFGYRIHSILADQYKQKFSDLDCFKLLVNSPKLENQLAECDHVHKSMYLWSKSALANYILKTLGDGMEMANSVEGRLPFLDHHLFEYVRKIPISLKIKEDKEKYILREAVQPLITKTVYRRQKHPFVAPPVSCYSTKTLDCYMQDMLRSKAFGELPFFDQSKVVSMLQQMPKMTFAERRAADPLLMMALTTLVAQQVFQL